MNQSKSLKAAIVSAILASICCVGPLVLLALGISGAWISNLTVLEPFRPIFMVITALILIYAFIKVYKKPAAEACEPGSYCANPKSDRINKISLWSVTILVVILFSIPYVANGLNNKESQKTIISNGQQIELKTVVLSVPDMTCASCPLTVRKSLEKVAGVHSAEVLFKPKLAIVKYDPEQATLKDLIVATTNAGYPSTIVEQNKK